MNAGRYYAAPYWTRWAVYDGLWIPGKRISDHDTQADAETAAATLNAPKPKPERQLALGEDVA